MVSKNVNFKMKTCKDFDVELCSACKAYKDSTMLQMSCWIEWYRGNVSHLSEDSPIMKRRLCAWIKNESGFPILYLGVMLKHYYPEKYEWYQKMMVLK